MYPQKNSESVSQAFFVITFLFLVIIFLLFRFGGTSDRVVNENLARENTESSKISVKDFLNQNESEDLYTKYLKEIYEKMGNSSSENLDIEKVVENYSQELSLKTLVPQADFLLTNISTENDLVSYRKSFEKTFQDLRIASGTSESVIFASQIQQNGEVLPLSDYDKESLLRLATEYKLFSDKLAKLETPISLTKNVERVGRASLNVSFILKKIVMENDKNIYPLWISKYSENMFVIIEERYAIAQK
jgi:hypothetical protein